MMMDVYIQTCRSNFLFLKIFLILVTVVNVLKKLCATAEFCKLNAVTSVNVKIPDVKILIDTVALLCA